MQELGETLLTPGKDHDAPPSGPQKTTPVVRSAPFTVTELWRVASWAEGTTSRPLEVRKRHRGALASEEDTSGCLGECFRSFVSDQMGVLGKSRAYRAISSHLWLP